MPSRVRSPKDKASVEGAVRSISTRIIAAIRHTQRFIIDELNKEVLSKLEEPNQRPFTRKKGCRLSVFEEEEKFVLSSFPTTPYKMSGWNTVKVRPDYHVSIESMFYSVPYEYINRIVEVRHTDDLVEDYFNYMRIDYHKRLSGNHPVFHMPDNDILFLEQTPESAIERAKGIGSSTLNVVQYVLEASQIEKLAVQSIFSLKIGTSLLKI